MDKAIEQYAKILEGLDGTPELSDELALFNKLGDLYLKRGDIKAAVERYEKAIILYAEQGFPNNAIALCNKVLRNAPGRTHVYLKLAKLMLQRGFVAEAKQNLLEYADRMQKTGQVEESFEALKEFADLSPDNEEIRLLLAEQLQKAARTDEAREQLAKLYHELQNAGDERRTRATMQRMRAIDPDYSYEEAPAPKVKSRKRQDSEIVFIDPYDEPKEAPPSQPPAATISAEPDAPLVVERTSSGVDESIAELETTDDASSVAGLDVGESFETPSDDTIPSIEIEPTLSAEDADTEPEPEPTVPAFDAVPEDGGGIEIEAPTLELASLDDTDREHAESVDPLEVKDEGGIEVPDLDIHALDAPSVDADDEAPTDDLPLLLADVLDLESEDASGKEEAEAVVESASTLISEGRATSGIRFDDPPEAIGVATPDVGALEDRVLEDPDAPGPHRELGEALIELGERERGIEELNHALNAFEATGDYSHARAVNEEILRLVPNDVDHQQMRVEYAVRSGEKSQVADAYLELADALVRNGVVERARPVYERVLEHDAENERALTALATLAPIEVEVASEELGEDDLLDDDLEPPDMPDVEVAAKMAEDAESPPTGAPAPVRQSGFVDLGSLILDEEVERDTRMRVEQGAPTGDEERDFQDMLAQFKKGIEANLDLDDSQAHYDLGIAFKEMGLLDEAIAEFQKALRSTDSRLRAAENLGVCFYEKGQYAIAGAVLRRAVENEEGGDETKIGLLYWLGRSEEEQGNRPGALSYYERIFMIDVNFHDVKSRVTNLTGANR
ncbi:MAG: tetratricopeptide repeat protein [Gammaproteobacteria bacterium]|nr:tetratricopeptide repeat protein [Gammaproteobacteria bacterium]